MEIHHHAIEGVDTPVEITAIDEKAHGGAYHEYDIRLNGVFNAPVIYIKFQSGPVLEAGLNGITEAALLAVVAHRLECWQSGDFPCDENQAALASVQEALEWLKARTQNRIARGVEGKSQA